MIEWNKFNNMGIKKFTKLGSNRSLTDPTYESPIRLKVEFRLIISTLIFLFKAKFVK